MIKYNHTIIYVSLHNQINISIMSFSYITVTCLLLFQLAKYILPTVGGGRVRESAASEVGGVYRVTDQNILYFLNDSRRSQVVDFVRIFEFFLD